MKAYKEKCTIEEHHKNDAVGSSLIRELINHSPAHYWHMKNNPKEPTPALVLGNAIHQAVLEPKLFKEQLAVEPVFGGTGSKLARENWHLANHGKTILKAEGLESIEGILSSISKHKQASKLISDGHAEESIFWTDEVSGVKCKARPDFIREGHIVVDIKSTLDANRFEFSKDIANFGYHIQAAMYLDGATALFGHEFDQFVIIACEKNAPFGINCFYLGQETLEEGRTLYMEALKTLAKCQAAGKYPNYNDSEIIPIGIPTWAFRGQL